MKKITLTKPENGWVNVIIDERTFMSSYVTNIPFDIIKNAKIALKEEIPFVMTFNLEMYGTLYLVSDYPSTHFIHEMDDKRGYYSIDMNMLEVIESLIGCLKNDIDAWAEWEEFDDGDKEIIKKNKNDLEKGIAEVTKLLEEENKE